MRLDWTQAAQWLAPGMMLFLLACAQASESAMQPIVHHLSYDVAGAEAVQKLPKAVVVVPAGKSKLAELISAFASAATLSRQEVRTKSHNVLLATGPLLDQPDQVAALPLRREGNSFTLALDYTSARATGRNLERNLRWLPMAQAAIPDKLAPGEYSVTVTWRAVSSLSNRAALPIESLSEAAKFVVHSP